MSWFFAIIFMLAGLALAVFLGLYLYRDPQKELKPRQSVLHNERNSETA
jgi:hypothetical protein